MSQYAIPTSSRPQLIRFSDWQSRFVDAVLRSMDTPFEWGKSDCVCMAANHIEAITGVDVIEDIRPHIQTQQTAMRFMAENGDLENCVRLVLNRYQCPKVEVNKAQRGDVLILGRTANESGRPAVATNIGRGEVIVPNELMGYLRVPIEYCVEAWRI